MAKTTEVVDEKQEQKPSKNVENEDVIVAKVEGVEQNGEPKEDNVQKMEVLVIDNGKNVHALTEKKVEVKESKAERKDMSSSPVAEKNTSPREESNFLSHLKVHEKKAFAKLKMKIDEIIKGKLWIENKNNVDETVEKKKDEAERSDVSQPHPTVDRSSSDTDMSNFPSDWKEYEKKALAELRAKVEESINGNHLFKGKKEQMDLQENAKSMKKVRKEKEKKEEKSEENDQKLVLEGKENENAEKNGAKESKQSKQDIDEKKNLTKETTEDKTHLPIDQEENLIVDKDIVLWGIPLLPSKGDNATDIILLKFLRAREFKVNDAFEMLRNTLQWRKENNIDSILKESLDSTELDMMCYMNGLDRQGHPVCYNNFGLLGDNEMYNKILGTEEKREKFLRWRVQLMEKGIQKLDFKPGGVSSLLQISNIRNTSGPSKKELWCSTKQVVGLLQDNYPEFVEKNIFINVPFWFYAFTALLSPFLTQQTRSKFVFARPSKVTETLLKYIPAEEIPVHCGGLKQENDSEFSKEDAVMVVVVKAGSTETINIPVSEAGTTLIWELNVSGWEVNYKEEFEPSHEGSYSIIVQRERKMGVQEGPVRNSFKNKEPGKVMLIVQNVSFKKKRVLYRHKIKKSSSSA